MFGLSFAVGLLSVQQKRSPVVLDYEGPPRRIEDVVDRAELIVVGVTEGRLQRVIGSGDEAIPVVQHAVRVLEVIKGPNTIEAQQVIQVSQPGGSAVSAGVKRTVDDRDFPVFGSQEKLILFLSFEKYYGTYGLKWGPGGAYPIQADRVRVPRGAAQVAAYQGKRDIPAADFLALIRRHASGKWRPRW